MHLNHADGPLDVKCVFGSSPSFPHYIFYRTVSCWEKCVCFISNYWERKLLRRLGLRWSSGPAWRIIQTPIIPLQMAAVNVQRCSSHLSERFPPHPVSSSCLEGPHLLILSPTPRSACSPNIIIHVKQLLVPPTASSSLRLTSLCADHLLTWCHFC